MSRQGVLAFMRKLKEESYTDSCRRLIFGRDNGRYGHGSAFTNGDVIPCKFVPRVTPDTLGAGLRTVDADLFFSDQFAMKADDRVVITVIDGIAQAAPETYAIVGGPVQTPVGKRAALSLVTGAS